MTGYVITLRPSGRRTITCLRCGLQSWHPVDVAERYCARCHGWHDPSMYGGDWCIRPEDDE